MLPLNITNDLDRIASEGIIDFDAAAFLTGTRPRYVGNPTGHFLPPTEIPVNNGQLDQPKTDAFIDPQSGLPKSQPDKSGNPLWKKILFGGLVAAGLVFGASKLKFVKNIIKNKKIAVPQGIKNFWTNTKQKVSTLWNNKKVPQGVKDAWSAVCKKCSDGWNWVKGLFGKKTP